MEFKKVASKIVDQARRDGVGSAAWTRLARNFAANEDELKLLTPSIGKGKKFGPETLTTMITLSDTITGTTTTQTTTTTSRLCSLPGICKPFRKSSAKSRKRK